jgi:hypothetical protein
LHDLREIDNAELVDGTKTKTAEILQAYAAVMLNPEWGGTQLDSVTFSLPRDTRSRAIP